MAPAATASLSVIGCSMPVTACEPVDNRTKGDRPLTATDFAICPDCGGTMRRIATVPRSCNPQPFSCDTS
jgi:hypothetical protein